MAIAAEVDPRGGRGVRGLEEARRRSTTSSPSSGACTRGCRRSETGPGAALALLQIKAALGGVRDGGAAAAHVVLTALVRAHFYFFDNFWYEHLNPTRNLQESSINFSGMHACLCLS